MYSSKDIKIYAIDNECHRIFNQAFAKDPYYLPSELIFPSSIQGFTLCDKKSKTPIASFYCFPYIAKRRWRKEGVLRITRPLILQCDTKLKKEAVNILMQEIYEIGNRAGVNAIEVELYREINSKIFFPSASCAINTYNTTDWIQIFESYGFVCSKVTLCFELNLDEFNEDNDQQIHIRKYIADDEEDKKMYYKLWSLSDDCPYYFGNYGFWYSNVFGWPRVWYSEIAHILNRDDYILFAEKGKEITGFIHWWPNLYSLMIKGGRKAIFVKENYVEELLDNIQEGKIFKIIVNKKMKNDKDLIEKTLINEAVKIMKKKFKFKRCQIGNIPMENINISSFIQENGGKKVHEVWLMRSKYHARFR
ncbi:MAG: hypothetical protein AB1488_02025 [Nitrospirota bacterium]